MFIRGSTAGDENIFLHWLFVNCGAYSNVMLADCEWFNIIYNNTGVYHRIIDKN